MPMALTGQAWLELVHVGFACSQGRPFVVDPHLCFRNRLSWRCPFGTSCISVSRRKSKYTLLKMGLQKFQNLPTLLSTVFSSSRDWLLLVWWALLHFRVAKHILCSWRFWRSGGQRYTFLLHGTSGKWHGRSMGQPGS